ncbi:hypothetical protein [Streptomyces decoyicus]|uniref:restriction endonuclease-related protein n=1 Tax=Streptomyces decoyicus TaxID=249567 RepID=UPI000A8F4657|nr:hypothetical protein [Streptomyces decoyicus]QZY15141.1 hypothetical protein K7C20_07655 [Streptomyces decoyicus]
MLSRNVVPGESARLARLSKVSPDLSDDYMTLQLLAAGLARIQLTQQGALWSTPSPVSDPLGLPAAWNAGVTRLWWRALERGQSELISHLDVFRWCRLPLGEWPLPLQITTSDVDLLLVEDGRPSAFADQAARLVLAKDPEAELVENRCYELLITTAERNASREEEVQQNYVYLRGFLIANPLATDLQLHELIRRFRAKDSNGQPWVKQWFLQAYQSRPSAGAVRMKVCGGCGNPLARYRPPCGTPGCVGQPAMRTLETMSEYYVQRRAVRRFFHDPGLSEQRILDAVMPVLGNRLHAWWGMDAVDAAIDFDGTGRMGAGEWWAADVKDHASAALLGRSFRWDPRADARRRFLVLAQHRFERPGYVDDLVREMEGRVRGVEVVSEASFIESVCARAREHG